MDRKMRRFKQLLPEQETVKILTEATGGVLSLTDTDGQPYGGHSGGEMLKNMFYNIVF